MGLRQMLVEAVFVVEDAFAAVEIAVVLFAASSWRCRVFAGRCGGVAFVGRAARRC